jgi:hypothetical protein
VAKIEIKVDVKPTSGKGSSKGVQIDATGASVAEVLKAGGLDAGKMNISVNNEPAQLNTHVGKGDTVTLTEKAAGS